jgi:hypothetical protein
MANRVENKECIYCGTPLIVLDIDQKRVEPYCYNCERDIVIPKINAWKEKRAREKAQRLRKENLDPRVQRRIKIHPAQIKATRG